MLLRPKAKASGDFAPPADVCIQQYFITRRWIFGRFFVLVVVAVSLPNKERRFGIVSNRPPSALINGMLFNILAFNETPSRPRVGE